MNILVSRHRAALLARALVVLPFVVWARLELRLRSTDWWVCRAQTASCLNTPGLDDNVDRAEVWAHVVDAVSRRVPGSTCLSKSLALVRCLTLVRIRACMRIGTKKDNEAILVMHAWVEVAGSALAEGSSGYAPFLKT